MNWHQLVSKIILPGCLLTCGNSLLHAEDEATDTANSPELFKQLDKNSDGILERSELDEDRHKFFDRLVRIADANEDGKLTSNEFADAIKPDRPATTDPFGAGNSNQRRGGDMTQMIRRFDRNGDQKISKDEIPDPLRERLQPLFERLGKDELTIQEFQSAMTRGQQMPDYGNRFLEQLDRNKNGKIELSELPERMRDGVQRMLRQQGKSDVDSLTKEEFAQVMRRGSQSRGPQPSPIFRKLDSDRNGRLSKEELAKAPEVLASLDTDGDGEVSLRELEPSPRPGMRPNDSRPDSNRDGLPSFMQEADKNNDGKISKEEAPERLQRGFDRIDADSDGFITTEEIRKAFQRRPQTD